MLGEHAERTEQEDGTVRFESDKGTLEWQADGNVQADYTLTESAPTSAAEALEQARRLCSRWGFQAEQANWTAEDTVVTLTGAVAGLPVHNRRLTLDFSAGDGSVSLVGLWSFGTPYTTANGISITCSAADALLQFAAESGETGSADIAAVPQCAQAVSSCEFPTAAAVFVLHLLGRLTPKQANIWWIVTKRRLSVKKTEKLLFFI